jgi:hypothetical protein
MAGLDAALVELETLSKENLWERYRQHYEQLPPPRLRRELALRAVAHRIQEEARGGPDPALRRRLARPAEELRRTGRIAVGARPPVKPGTRLLREWNGGTHCVTVTHDGFEYRGARYRSLSKIARTITGTRWSGPAFFGLKGRERS